MANMVPRSSLREATGSAIGRPSGLKVGLPRGVRGTVVGTLGVGTRSEVRSTGRFTSTLTNRVRLREMVVGRGGSSMNG